MIRKCTIVVIILLLIVNACACGVGREPLWETLFGGWLLYLAHLVWGHD